MLRRLQGLDYEINDFWMPPKTLYALFLVIFRNSVLEMVILVFLIISPFLKFALKRSTLRLSILPKSMLRTKVLSFLYHVTYSVSLQLNAVSTKCTETFHKEPSFKWWFFIQICILFNTVISKIIWLYQFHFKYTVTLNTQQLAVVGGKSLCSN